MIGDGTSHCTTHGSCWAAAHAPGVPHGPPQLTALSTIRHICPSKQACPRQTFLGDVAKMKCHYLAPKKGSKCLVCLSQVKGLKKKSCQIMHFVFYQRPVDKLFPPLIPPDPCFMVLKASYKHCICALLYTNLEHALFFIFVLTDCFKESTLHH